MNRAGKYALALLGVILFAFYPNKYLLNVMVFAGIYAILAVGLNLLLGLAGQVSLGHNAFYALGAYGVGVLALKCNMPAWICIPAALALTAGLAYLIGWPTLRLHGHYLALATLGVGLIVQFLLNESAGLTGGPSGLINIPRLKFGSVAIYGDRAFLVLVWSILLIVQFGLARLRKSRMGRALLAVHGNELAAASLGVDIGREKRAVFVASATLAGLAGVLYAYYIRFISPETFGFHLSVQVLTMAVAGGLGTVWGPVLGACLLTMVPEMLRAFKDYDIILYGLVLILTVAFLPDGLAVAVRRLWERARRLWERARRLWDESRSAAA